MTKSKRGRYTLEFKQEAVRLVESGQSPASMRGDMRSEIVIDALEMALFQRSPGKDAGLIFHSDRGSQYAGREFHQVLHECGIKPSMSRKGNCWDNACSETLFGSLKSSGCMECALEASARPRTRPSTGCSGMTGHGCTRR